MLFHFLLGIYFWSFIFFFIQLKPLIHLISFCQVLKYLDTIWIVFSFFLHSYPKWIRSLKFGHCIQWRKTQKLSWSLPTSPNPFHSSGKITWCFVRIIIACVIPWAPFLPSAYFFSHPNPYLQFLQQPLVTRRVFYWATPIILYLFMPLFFGASRCLLWIFIGYTYLCSMYFVIHCFKHWY